MRFWIPLTLLLHPDDVLLSVVYCALPRAIGTYWVSLFTGTPPTLSGGATLIFSPPRDKHTRGKPRKSGIRSGQPLPVTALDEILYVHNSHIHVSCCSEPV